MGDTPAPFGPLHEALREGMPLLFGGDRIVRLSAAIAAVFAPGDQLLVTPDGDVLHVTSPERRLAADAVGAACDAFLELGEVSDERITAFYEGFAARLDDDGVFAVIETANGGDVAAARAKGRSSTRLALTPTMRADMAAGLRGWKVQASSRDTVVEVVERPGLRVEQRRAGLGVVGFVFEGRPNVFADATGVLRGGNAVVLRIGSDALGTARAIMTAALRPALASAGLPLGCVQLLDSPSRATGWALFADPRLALAVARGSGPAVAQLGAVARQAGTPVSLHGTGGAWLVAAPSASGNAFGQAVLHSLDRKVCNTLNVCAIVADRALDLVPVFLDALAEAARRRGTDAKLHVDPSAHPFVPAAWFDRKVAIRRAEGDVEESAAEPIADADLGREWEWEESPEVSLVVVKSVAEAVTLFNRLSPRLVASILSEDAEDHDMFWRRINAPFVGNGFTRWVDGQYALNRPELGLSNWQHGRLLARSAVLSGDSVFTVRTRAIQTDYDLHR